MRDRDQRPDRDAKRKAKTQTEAIEEIADQRLEHHAQLERTGHPAILFARYALFTQDDGCRDTQHRSRQIIQDHRADEHSDDRPADIRERTPHSALTGCGFLHVTPYTLTLPDTTANVVLHASSQR
jgi:hypothetical protein